MILSLNSDAGMLPLFGDEVNPLPQVHDVLKTDRFRPDHADGTGTLQRGCVGQPP